MMLCSFALRDLRIFMAIKHHEINTWQKSQKFNSRQISDVLTLTLANQMRLFRHFLSDIINGFFFEAVIQGIHRSKQNFRHAGSFCFRRRSSPLNTTEKHSQKTGTTPLLLAPGHDQLIEHIIILTISSTCHTHRSSALHFCTCFIVANLS